MSRRKVSILGATGSIAAGQQGKVTYEFRGELAATPPPVHRGRRSRRGVLIGALLLVLAGAGIALRRLRAASRPS